MLPEITFLRREFLIGMLFIWVIASVVSFLNNWPEIFSAIGAISLSIGLSIFLTHRYISQEERRLWDNQEEIQQRMIWRYMQMIRLGRQGNDPLTPEQLAERLEDSFESMLESKRSEAKMETYRYEMAYSVLGTLQWGLGGMIVELIHG